jgi:hypothetical protein
MIPLNYILPRPPLFSDGCLPPYDILRHISWSTWTIHHGIIRPILQVCDTPLNVATRYTIPLSMEIYEHHTHLLFNDKRFQSEAGYISFYLMRYGNTTTLMLHCFDLDPTFCSFGVMDRTYSLAQCIAAPA